MNAKIDTPWFIRIPAILALCLAQTGLVHMASGETQEWRGNLHNTGTLDFSNDDHWTGTGVPGSGDVAVFTGTGDQAIPGGSAFTVRLTGNVTNQAIQWTGGSFTVTFDLNGHTHATTLIDPSGLIQGTGATGVVVNLTGGTANWENLDVGHDASTKGTLNVYGSDTTLNIVQDGTPNTVVYVGRYANSSGTLDVSDGAVFTVVHNLVMGTINQSTGTFRVSNASATVSNHLWIGDYGHGELVIENGGVVDVQGGARYVVFAQRAGGTATGLITGAGSLLRSNATTDTRGIGIGGDPHESNAGAWAHVTVADQGRMESTRRIRILGGSSLTVDNGTVQADTDFLVNDAAAGNESKLAFVIYNAQRDALIQAGSNVNIGANVELDVTLGTGYSFASGDFVELIQFGNTLTGTFKDYGEGSLLDLGLGGGLVFEVTYAGGVDDKRMGLTVIPEPGVLAMVLPAALAVALLRRRRSVCR